ncbi:hypothetical protein ACLI09_10755 [Flavobacterium sp. RHBU_24]|uniref:hypothetical protein n=1 Tax=Flavobacterium sp. RHBU_24 TaxID=3391185 RepID=UPI0039852371
MKNSILTYKESVIRSIMLSVIFFLTMVVHYIYKAGIGGLLIKTFSAMKTPWFDIGDALLAIILVILIFILRTKKVKISKSISYISLLFNVVLISATPLWDEGNIILIIVGLIGNILIFIATYNIWMLVISTAFKKSWITLSIVGMGAQLGVYVGAYIGQVMVVNIKEEIPALIGGMYIIIFLLITRCIKKFSCEGTKFDGFYPEEAQKVNTIEQQLKKGFSPYIKTLLFLILIGSVFGRSINWLVQQQADYKNTIEEASGFLADFYQSGAILSILCQLMITPIALKYLKDKRGLILQPILAILIPVFLLAKINISVNIIFLMIFTAFDYTLYNSFKEKLWLHTPLVNKIYHKAIAALIIPKIAGVLNALSILIIAGYDYSIWIAYIIIISLIWLFTVIYTVYLNENININSVEAKPTINAV